MGGVGVAVQEAEGDGDDVAFGQRTERFAFDASSSTARTEASRRIPRRPRRRGFSAPMDRACPESRNGPSGSASPERTRRESRGSSQAPRRPLRWIIVFVAIVVAWTTLRDIPRGSGRCSRSARRSSSTASGRDRPACLRTLPMSKLPVSGIQKHRKIREGAADVDADPQAHLQTLSPNVFSYLTKSRPPMQASKSIRRNIYYYKSIP